MACVLLDGGDMEMSCDEKVVKERGSDAQKEYSHLLLAAATQGRSIAGGPLAFSEGRVKERTKNVLKSKKSSRIVLITVVILVLALGIGLLLNRVQKQKPIVGGVLAPRTYVIEDNKDKWMWKLSYISLLEDGTVNLGIPPISSYLPPPCRYSIDGEKLLLHSSISNADEESFFGTRDGSVIAVFKIIDETTLEFVSSNVPLFGETGARFIYYENNARQWVNYYDSPSSMQSDSIEMELEEYLGVVFKWTPGEVTATDGDTETTLFSGMPIWNVFIADLNGDLAPELYATVSYGSGIVDTRIVGYDYRRGTRYVLEDRAAYDYALSLENGVLVVMRTEYNGTESVTGSLVYADGEIRFLQDQGE